MVKLLSFYDRFNSPCSVFNVSLAREGGVVGENLANLEDWNPNRIARSNLTCPATIIFTVQFIIRNILHMYIAFWLVIKFICK